MRMRIWGLGAAVLAVAAMAGVRAGGDEPKSTRGQTAQTRTKNQARGPKVVKTDAEWRQQLSEMEYYVTRRKGTEQAFTGRYWDHHGDGLYRCVGCSAPLFDSTTKFESGTGWPSFFAPIENASVRTETDRSNFAVRTEVLCRTCDAHLGHVFRDGPRPTGLRFCMNSAALTFQDRAAAEAETAAKAVLEADPKPEGVEEEVKPPEGEEPGTSEPPSTVVPATGSGPGR